MDDLARPDQIAFSDGEKVETHANAVPRHVAFTLFTLVGHPDLGVQTIDRERIREIYGGEYDDWAPAAGREGFLPSGSSTGSTTPRPAPTPSGRPSTPTRSAGRPPPR
ncbi:hypothetical protein GCM10022221_44200 [Actinocorallia aurea]